LKQGLQEKGQKNHSMGLEWRKVCALAPKATTQVRVFAFGNPHINCWTSSTGKKNKPHEEVTKYAFILRPFSMVANSYCALLKKNPAC
jgi:hypothetical protein